MECVRFARPAESDMKPKEEQVCSESGPRPPGRRNPRRADPWPEPVAAAAARGWRLLAVLALCHVPIFRFFAWVLVVDDPLVSTDAVL